MDFTIRVAKTKALISFAVTAKLICVFVFAYAKTRFSHDAAHISLTFFILLIFTLLVRSILLYTGKKYSDLLSSNEYQQSLF